MTLLWFWRTFGDGLLCSWRGILREGLLALLEHAQTQKIEAVSDSCDLRSIFTVRCDIGRLYQVHGWLVDVTILERPSKFYLM